MVTNQNSQSSRNVIIIAAAIVAILIAVFVIGHVIRSNQPNVTYSPIANVSAKATWLKQQRAQMPNGAGAAAMGK